MMAHHFEIKQNKAGEYVARFKYNKEAIWFSEGYSSKASARSAIDSVIRNGPGSPTEDDTPDEVGDDLDIFRNAVVPASDRIVSPDHNSREYKEFEKARERLSERLLQGNDLREFKTQELDVARDELAKIDIELRQSSFRAEHFWNMGKSTLLWIATKAADGIVKALAVAALVALAALLGIKLPIG